MLRYLAFGLLLAAAMLAYACGGTGNDRNVATLSLDGGCVAHADVELAGSPATVRLWAEYTGDSAIVSWAWVVHGHTYDAPLPDGEFWLTMPHPGFYNVTLRGIDANGNTCSAPIRVRSSRSANAAPVVLFDGPLDYGEGTQPQSDGTALRYHEWRWSVARSYDPETSIASYEWGIFGGDDIDGDGIPDEVYAGKTARGFEFSSLPGLIVKNIDDPQQMIVWVTPELAVSPLRMAVIATDTYGVGRKWGDGHITLMK